MIIAAAQADIVYDYGGLGTWAPGLGVVLVGFWLVLAMVGLKPSHLPRRLVAGVVLIVASSMLLGMHPEKNINGGALATMAYQGFSGLGEWQRVFIGASLLIISLLAALIATEWLPLRLLAPVGWSALQGREATTPSSTKARAAASPSATPTRTPVTVRPRGPRPRPVAAPSSIASPARAVSTAGTAPAAEAVEAVEVAEQVTPVLSALVADRAEVGPPLNEAVEDSASIRVEPAGKDSASEDSTAEDEGLDWGRFRRRPIAAEWEDEDELGESDSEWEDEEGAEVEAAVADEDDAEEEWEDEEAEEGAEVEAAVADEDDAEEEWEDEEAEEGAEVEAAVADEDDADEEGEWEWEDEEAEEGAEVEAAVADEDDADEEGEWEWEDEEGAEVEAAVADEDAADEDGEEAWEDEEDELSVAVEQEPAETLTASESSSTDERAIEAVVGGAPHRTRARTPERVGDERGVHATAGSADAGVQEDPVAGPSEEWATDEPTESDLSETELPQGGLEPEAVDAAVQVDGADLDRPGMAGSLEGAEVEGLDEDGDEEEWDEDEQWEEDDEEEWDDDEEAVVDEEASIAEPLRPSLEPAQAGLPQEPSVAVSDQADIGLSSDAFEASFDEDQLAPMDDLVARLEDAEVDPFVRSIQVLLETETISLSRLQRELKATYYSAARVFERLEGAGMISTYDGSLSRDVTLNREAWGEWLLQRT